MWLLVFTIKCRGKTFAFSLFILPPTHLIPDFFSLCAGVSSLINLLSSAQDEDQPKLNILLCEAVVAVYLSLLIHALATNSCNELFRLAAHPLNSRMWAAVFGGGVKLLVKPRRQSESIPGTLLRKVTLMASIPC